ncbi:ArsR/SmtB family transcription factor [Clostridium peptidivorans]|uniref:ArsR/SmtB family transcription factor n=1 Tax=Clostridium peptidivorans TaxID=100174 RepID=UPI000BE3111C|nr:metalloregulator ArsR/SmtB family transcription factor [Clostridium peptidivorans]
MQTNDEQIEIYTKFFHGLSNATRYKILLSLINGEKSVGELVEDTGCSQSLISMQLKCLKWCNFVKATKEGKNIYYSISDKRIIVLVQLGQSIAEGNTNRICTCEILKNEGIKPEEAKKVNGKENSK